MCCRDLLVALTLVVAGDSAAQLTLLDPSFGANGTVLLGLSGFGGDNAEDVAVQPDGRIVVVGKRNGTEDDMAVLRFLEDGSLDPTFSSDGKAFVEMGVNAEARVVALQADGNILVAGNAEFIGGGFFDLAFARLTSAGVLDQTFSTDGRFSITGPGAADVVLALAVQPDGRILAAGKFDGNVSDMMALRLTSEGSLDETFADNGIFNTDLQTGELAEDLVLRTDGRIVLCGAWRLTLPDADMAMLQLDADGIPDPSFGVEGLFRPSETFSVSAVISASEVDQESILVLGRRYMAGGSNEEVFTGRVLLDGTWDTSYGTGGRSFLPLGFGFTGSARDMVVLPDGKALIAVDVLESSTASILVMRVLPDGGLDPSFGTAGRVIMPCPGNDCHVRSLALDAQGRVVAAGTYAGVQGTEVMVMRWLPQASPLDVPAAQRHETLRVFPIPASDAVQLDVPDSWLIDARLELSDACGRMIQLIPGRNLSGRRLQLPAELAGGNYVLRLVSEERTSCARVVVDR